MNGGAEHLMIIGSHTRACCIVCRALRRVAAGLIPVVLALATLVAPPPHASAADEETTRELNGTTITYLYTSGRSYQVRFEEAGVSYRYLTGSKPDKWWGPFPYQAMRVGHDVYFASWFEEGYGDYVTLLADFGRKILHGSAIIEGKEVHFHRAEILKIQRP